MVVHWFALSGDFLVAQFIVYIIMLEIESLEYDKDYFAKGRWGKVYKGRYNKSSVCVKEIKKSPAYITDGELIKALLKECSTLKRYVCRVHIIRKKTS